MTKYINQNNSYTFADYSITPELNDSLLRGIIYQKDLQLSGNPVSTALGFSGTGTSDIATAPATTVYYPFASPNNGPLLRQIQGASGFRYMLARYDGALVTGATTAAANAYYPIAGTQGSPYSFTAFTQSKADGSITPTTPIKVLVSDGINDSITITPTASGSVATKLNTFGGFVNILAAATSTTPAAYNNPYWEIAAPAYFYPFVGNTKQVLPYYQVDANGNGLYVITVGDYVWLRFVGQGSGNVQQEQKKK